MNGSLTIGGPGLPMLPIKTMKVLLPQEGVLDSINVTYDGNTSMGEGYNVLLGVNGTNESEEQNQSVEPNFNTSIPYPTELFTNFGTYYFRGYSILTFNIHPVYYINDTGEIYYYKNMTVTITTNDTGSVHSLFRGLAQDETWMKQIVDDYSMNYTYTSIPDPPDNTSIVNSSLQPDFVIITKQAFVNADPFPPNARDWRTFQDLADYKNENTDFVTEIVTLEEIYAEDDYEGCDNQETIRNFIRHAYQTWQIDYVLLGGDNSTFLGNELLPARNLWYKKPLPMPNIWPDALLPSDLYYACLDGTFNFDGDQWWGEPHDGENGDDVDLEAEVYIGRAPVGSTREVSNFVYKTLEFEKTKDNEGHLRKALLVGSYLSHGAYGATYKEEIIGECTKWVPEYYPVATKGLDPNIFDITPLYDLYWPNFDPQDPEKTGWKARHIRKKINEYRSFQIINNKGHGDTDMIWRTNNLGTLLYTNNKYFFVYSMSCDSGGFDNYKDGDIKHAQDCIAEYLTVKTKHGAFAAIMNAREGFYVQSSTNTKSESQKLDRLFFNATFNRDIMELGRANQLSKQEIINEIYSDTTERQKFRTVYYETNLFGDPTVSLKIPTENLPPVKPDKPVKTKILGRLYMFETRTTDPNNDRVSYRWRFDDEMHTEGDGLYWKSGQTAYYLKVLEPGSHWVDVRASDEFDINSWSPWSDKLEFEATFDTDIEINPSTVVLGENVQFNGQASEGAEPYATWYYDLGDGNNSEQQNTTHAYNTLGTYNVTLNVTDDQNITSNVTKVVNVVILKADFDSSSGYGIPNETIYFNDTSDGYHTLTNWSWDFGDGNISYDRNTSHAYAAEGVYNVSLTVTDNESNNNVSYQIIYIDIGDPEITSHFSDLDEVGYGYNITIITNLSDSVSGIKNGAVNITYPDDTYGNFSMNNTGNNTYEYIFNDTWQLGDYSYSIWTVDHAENANSSSQKSFTVLRSFGYRKVGNSNQSILDTITGSRFKVNLKGVADNVSVYIDPGNAISEYHYQCMIYRHNDSKLMGISEEKNISSGKDWQIFNFSVPKPVLMNDTDYVLACWADNYTVKMYYNNGTGDEMLYPDGNSTLQWHYFEGIYNYTPDINNFHHEDRKYSIYCQYSLDNTSPEITNVSASPSTVGFGFNVTISADVTDNASGVNNVTVNVTYPDTTTGNFTLNNIENNTYEYVFSDTWLVGRYNYTIWVVDYANNSNSSSEYSFNVSANATISVCTIKDSYGNNEIVNLTDPPGDPPEVGYELLDDGDVLHIWNRFDSYYFNTSSGIQLTNHKDDYWSHNVLMLGYYNNDEWNLIYRTDELSGFNKDINTDNETYVNATIWKNLTYSGYDFRLAIRYYLGVDDNELTVIPYIKNIDDDDIPYILGFGWEIKDIQIDMTSSGDYIEVNRTIYYLNQTLNNTYTNLLEPEFYLMENITDTSTKSLYLRWNQSLTYKLQVKSRTGQYNAPVTLFIRIGTLNISQEKYTKMYWYDAAQVTYYFNHYKTEAWATDPGNMADGEDSFASTSSDDDVELCDGNTCSGSDLGTISKVELRVYGYYTGIQRDIILRPVFGGETDGSNYSYQPPDSEPDWSSWFDITNDESAPEEWEWDNVDNLDCDVEVGPGIFAFTLYCGKVDIRVTYYHVIEISNPYPPDGSTGISISPILNITVSDPYNDTMNITWYSNSSGSWQVFETNNSVNNGTYHQTFSNATINGQWWYWKVNVTDGTHYNESSVYKFYTGNQSKIKNTGSTNITGYLLIQVHYYNTSNSTWVVAADTVNETTPRVINSSEQLGLDTVFNGLVNTATLSSYGNGKYRVYAAFRDPDGNILVTDEQTQLVATYEFTITFS